MMHRLLQLCVAALLFSTPTVSAQTSAYYWDDVEGGLVDRQTGLVWGFGPTAVGGPTYSYLGAIRAAANDYAKTEFGFPFTDWDVPTKAELVDGASKGMYAALSAEYAMHFPTWSLPVRSWASDAPFKSKGTLYGYVVELGTGQIRNFTVDSPKGHGSIFPAIVVRQASLP